MVVAEQRLPLISIVIPSFNQGQFLRDALESVLRQDYPRLELAVMDGGSTDDSRAAIESYGPRLTFWQSGPDGGQAAAINAGIRRCQGDLVAWLNADDFYCGEALWTIARAYLSHPGRGLYIGNGFRYDEETKQLTPFCPRHVVLNRTALIEGLDYILQPATFFSRQAWDAAGGLNEQLTYCLDWDLIIRIAKNHAAVLINDPLATSREHSETKTSRGHLARVVEIARVARVHSGSETTPGTLHYALETLLRETTAEPYQETRQHLDAAFEAVRAQLASQYGNADGFPERGDPQDVVYLPFACRVLPHRPSPATTPRLPSISVIVPSLNHAAFLDQALGSIAEQDYPQTETVVFDGGSADDSVEVLRLHATELAHWASEPDRGPAHAINKGFARATGEILGWLSADDLLADEALWEIGRAFAADPQLDMVYANALYIDAHNRLRLADHGGHRTGVYRGAIQPLARIPAYWSYVHAVPQPTVFFRRRLLERCGALDESLHNVFDFELFWRFTRHTTRIKKIERTLAFYRLHDDGKSADWSRFLVELYRVCRPAWPPARSKDFRQWRHEFLEQYLRRRFGERHGLPRTVARARAALSITTRIGNPESYAQPVPPGRKAPFGRDVPATPANSPLSGSRRAAAAVQDGDPRKYHSLFHSYLWPRSPGHFGGEIRDFHLLQHLLSFSHVEFFASMAGQNDDGRDDVLGDLVDALHTPETISRERPDLVDSGALTPQLLSRVASVLRHHHVPVVGPRYHLEAIEKLPSIKGFSSKPLAEALLQNPDFLFVSPQTNPLALTIPRNGERTALIMASYDVEAVRLQRAARAHRGITRMALALEARRGAAFERDNLRHYDGVIAVSELDRKLFVESYGVPSERVLVVENGVDLEYFAFAERQQRPAPLIVFVGTFSYWPNEDAGWRLVDHIIPRLRSRHPAVQLALVGQGPSPALLARHDGRQTIVTGRVEDVRPWLARATVACVPLRAGSGTKYKVLEAMSAGVPTVCSALAVEGLDVEPETHVLLGDSDDELAAAIERLLADPLRAANLAERARAYVEKRHGWSTTVAPLADWLAHIAALPHRAG